MKRIMTPRLRRFQRWTSRPNLNRTTFTELRLVNSGTTRKVGSGIRRFEVKGDLCINLDEHPSGHFTKVVWKRGVGLIEYASNYGAEREGFRLKRSTPKKP